MKQIRRGVGRAILAVMMLALPLGAAQRTFVSAGSGNDANSCSRSAPCRSFDAALAVTDPGGEVVVLDSGGYGPFSAAASATIDAPSGVAAAITVFSGSGIQFNGGSGDRLIVRGVQLTGLGGAIGVMLNGGDALHLERVLVTGFSILGALAGAGGVLTIHDSAFIGNWNAVQIGNGVVTTNGVISGSRFEGNENSAASSYQSGQLTIRDSVFAGNNTALFAFANSVSTTSTVAVESSTFAANQIAVRTFAGSGISTIWVSDSTIVLNTVGISSGDHTDAPILTRSNNTVRDNETDGSFSGSFAAE